jgi:hypothetical protein
VVKNDLKEGQSVEQWATEVSHRRGELVNISVISTILSTEILTSESCLATCLQTDKNFMLGCYFPEGKRFANATFVKGEGGTNLD